MGDKWEKSVNSCGPRSPEWETSVGDKCGRQAGDKGETSVNSCGPRHAEWETRRPKEPRVGDKCGRQVWETSGRQVGDTCKLMRPKAPRVGDKGETSVNSCGPRNPEWETRGGQVYTHAAQGTQSGRQVWETSVGDKCGRQVGHKCKLMRPKDPEWETRGRQV